MKHLFRLALLIVLVATATIGFMPRQEAKAQDSITCGRLFVNSNVWNSLPNPVYRVNGNGPGLPSAGVAIPTSTWTKVSWTIEPGGTWSGLYLEYSDGGAGPWTVSGYSLTASCDAVGCIGGEIPSTAVGGTITENATFYWEPGGASDTVLEAGKTFWMDGLDATGMYRRVLVACEWGWVEASKTGPNFDDVWNGTPLPNHVVE